MDPLAGEYAGWSPYNYVLGNPIKFVDPDGMQVDDIIIRGSGGSTFNWTVGSTYDGDDEFIQQAVSALNTLGADPSTANFTFHGTKASGVVFEGNAVLDYASGGKKDHLDVFIEHADNNPNAPGESQHVMGTVYWNPSRGIAEEGFNGMEGGGAFPSMGILVHEMGHAALYHEFGGSDWRDREGIFPQEEKMIIDRLERTAMEKLGFGYRTWHNTYESRSSMLEMNSGSTKHKIPFKASYFIPSVTPTNLDK